MREMFEDWIGAKEHEHQRVFQWKIHYQLSSDVMQTPLIYLQAREPEYFSEI